MGGIVDLVLVGELAMVVTALMQIVKSHPRMPGSAVPYISGIVGVVASLLWFLVNGELYDGGMDWINLYKSVAVGIVGAVASIMGYNLQKALPTPNLLPTSNELNQQRMKEDVAATGAAEVTTTASFTTEVIKEETTLINTDDSIEKDTSETVITTTDKEASGDDESVG